jgi:preprotein translocase subunit YajC
VEALPNVLLLVLAAGLLLLMFSRANAARRTAQKTQESLQPGMQVMTASGLFARVVEVEEKVVVLETGPGQHSRWNRLAIATVIPDQPAATGDPEPGAEPADRDATDRDAADREAGDPGPGAEPGRAGEPTP